MSLCYNFPVFPKNNTLQKNTHSWTLYSLVMVAVTHQGNVPNFVLIPSWRHQKILYCSETVDKREVHNKSPNMEREAVHRALGYLQGKVTDSSTAVTKMLGMLSIVNNIFQHLKFLEADEHPQIKHSMDVWHKAKLLKKVLNNVSV